MDIRKENVFCSREILLEQGFENSCDADHFFPHMLKEHFNFKDVNQVWNLVLACKGCNRGAGGKFYRIPDITFLEALNKRNNFYIESHHPLKETIKNQTGRSHAERRTFLQGFYDSAVDAIPSKEKWKPRENLGERF